MRALFLLLAVLVVAGGEVEAENKIGNFFKKIGDSVKEAFLKFGHRTEEDLDRTRDILKKFREKVGKRLAERAREVQEQQSEMRERLRKLFGDISKEKGYRKALSIIEMNRNLSDYLYQGDIALDAEEAARLLGGDEDNGEEEQKQEQEQEQEQSRRRKRLALNDQTFPSNKWGLTIPYTFHSSVSASTKTLIQKVLQTITNATCLTFQENASATNKLLYRSDQSGCWSYVGKQPRMASQDVNIGRGCEQVGVITHETSHALGLFHAQSRYDRDDWLTLVTDNIQDAQLDQFNKETTQTMTTLGVAYDYGSVMQYNDVSFSVDGTSKTMIAKLGTEWQRTMGQRMGLAWSDLQIINKYYKCWDVCSTCFKKTATTKAQCKNGGVVAPRDWSRCLCPSGYGGTLCDELQKPNVPANVPNTCAGAVLKATSSWQSLSGSIGLSSQQQPDMTQYASCHWRIEAPAGQKVAIEVQRVGNVCSQGCQWGNVEVKIASDPGKTGIRMCCTDDLGATGTRRLTSEANVSVVSLYTSVNVQRFTLRYMALAS